MDNHKETLSFGHNRAIAHMNSEILTEHIKPEQTEARSNLSNGEGRCAQNSTFSHVAFGNCQLLGQGETVSSKSIYSKSSKSTTIQ